MSSERSDAQVTNHESPEVNTPLKIGIYEETDKLKTVAIWGPVGAEACLTQLFPEEISLFLSHMDVREARRECESFSSTLRQSFGVKVIEVRDELAQTITPGNLKKEQIQKELLEKADAIVAQYQPNLTPSQIKYNKNSIIELLDEDIQKYGQDRALTLNHILSLTRYLPLGNALYARDQMNVLLDKIIVANMAKPIRKPEVALYSMIYNKILEPGSNIKIPNSETFEGGDAYVHNSNVYVGIGARTTINAAQHLYEKLKVSLKEKNFGFVLVVDENPIGRNPNELMDFMHLDTFSMPIGPKQILVCEEEARSRKVYVPYTTKQGSQFVSIEKTFFEFLEGENEDIVIVPKEEQSTFGVNLLVIDNRTILVPLESNENTISQLNKTGKNILNLDLAECTKGYGAAHCMTGQLLRVPE